MRAGRGPWKSRERMPDVTSAVAKTLYAVVMGDIVESEQAPSKRVLHDHFNTAIDAANRNHADVIASPMTITLGDEFQGVVMSCGSAFKVVHDLRLCLLRHNVQCRFVIGDFKPETPINPDRAWNMLGKGLAEARERLAEKTDPNAYRFVLGDEPASSALLDAAGSSLTFLEGGWTRTQRAHVLAHFLDRLSVSQIANQNGTTERAVYKVLGAAHLNLYRTQLQAIEGFLRACS